MPVRYELLLRFNEQTGEFKGAAARYSDGSLMPITPATLGDWLPDALTEALAANAALQAQVASLTTERDTAVADLFTRTTERDALQAQIDAAAGVAADSVDALALELVLSQQGLLPAVLAYVESQGEQVQVYWRRVRVMRRASPLIEAARVALGLTNEQVDALFAAAAQVVT